MTRLTLVSATTALLSMTAKQFYNYTTRVRGVMLLTPGAMCEPMRTILQFLVPGDMLGMTASIKCLARTDAKIWQIQVLIHIGPRGFSMSNHGHLATATATHPKPDMDKAERVISMHLLGMDNFKKTTISKDTMSTSIRPR